MNTTQKIITVVGLVGVFILFCLAPWEISKRRNSSIPDSYTELAPLWDAPSVDLGSARLRSEVLAFELLGVACATYAFAVIFRSKSRQPAVTNSEPMSPAADVVSATQAPVFAANHDEATNTSKVWASVDSSWRRRLHSRLAACRT